MTPLHIACINGHDNIVQLLFDNGADINAVCRKMESPIHLPCKMGYCSIVQLLIIRVAEIML